MLNELPGIMVWKRSYGSCLLVHNHACSRHDRTSVVVQTQPTVARWKAEVAVSLFFVSFYAVLMMQSQFLAEPPAFSLGVVAKFTIITPCAAESSDSLPYLDRCPVLSGIFSSDDRHDLCHRHFYLRVRLLF